MKLLTTSVLSIDEENFLRSELGEELVMMNLSNGNFLGLNSIGSDILKKIDGERSISEIVSLLIEEYEVDKSQCEEDILEYLSLLVSKGILLEQNLENKC